jgi:hypothetical protein
MNDEEQSFVRVALARVEKAQKIQRVRQIAATVLAFAAAFWLAFQPSGPELKIECVVITGIGLIAAVCTTKIKTLINRNTAAVLQAIADLKKP